MSELRVDPENLAKLDALRAKAQQTIQRIGELEVQKQRHVGSLADVEDQANELLGSIAHTLGIDPNTPFQVTKDGVVVMAG